MLLVRRRHWLIQETGKLVNREWNPTAEGMRYAQGFATFLKRLIGYLPDT